MSVVPVPARADAVESVGWTGRVMQYLHVATALIGVNLLFLLGVLLGFGVFGLMPASVAAVAVLRRGELLTGTSEDGLVRAFARTYRAEFLRANLAGLPFGVAVGLLTVDALLLPSLRGPASAALLVLTGLVLLGTALSGVVTVVLLSRYDDRAPAVLRYAVVLPVTSVPMSIAVIATIAAWATIVAVFPVLLPLVGAAVPLAILVRLIDRRLDRIEQAG